MTSHSANDIYLLTIISTPRTLQGGHHDLRHGSCPGLCYDDADSDPKGADEAEDDKVGIEDELPGPCLHQLQANAERDDKLMAGDG